MPFPLEQRSQRERKFDLPKQREEGSNIFKGLLSSHCGLSKPSHISALVFPSRSLACLQSICFVSALQHITPNLTLCSYLPFSSLSVSYWTYSVPGVLSVALVFIHFPPSWLGPFRFHPLNFWDLRSWDSLSSVYIPWRAGGDMHSHQ
jgi:hypothetical protein